MKNLFLILLFLSIVFLSCKKTTITSPLEENKYTSSASIDSNNNFVYNEVFNLKKNSDYNLKNEVKKLNLNYHSLSIKIGYISERAYISIQNENNKLFDWKPFKINFYYDMSFADAEKDVHLLLKDGDSSSGYLLFPAFTEQYSTYFVYYFTKDVFNYIGNYEFPDFSKGSFSFNERLKELTVSSSGTVKKLNKIKETNAENFDKVDEDILLLKENNDFVFNKDQVQDNVDKDFSKTTVRSDFKAFNFSGQWQTDCTTDEYVSHLLFYDKDEAILEIYNKGKFVAKLMIDLDRENKSLKYVATNIIDENIGHKNIEGLSKGEVIGELQIVENNQITISWNGLYNNKTKQKMFVQNPFSEKKSCTIKKCRE